MEKEIIRGMKIAITYLAPATAIVMVQIYYRQKWIGLLQTLSLFFGAITSGVMFTDLFKVLLDVFFKEFMVEYGDRLEYFIVGFSVIMGFYLLLFLFAREEIFKVFSKLNKKW